MDNVIWLVAGNKGGAGKSVVAKSLVEWLKEQGAPISIVDGDIRTPDVCSVFAEEFSTKQFALHEDSGWPNFTDYLCQNKIRGHIVTNMPDGINDRAILFFERFTKLVIAHGYQVKVLFVMNPLPDGLHLFSRLAQAFPDVIPVKNLHFGSSHAFVHFDSSYGDQFLENCVLFPQMNPRIMLVVRDSNLSYSAFLEQCDDSESNFLYAKLVVADWRDNMLEALDDILMAN